jgi:hypothetical protein
MQLEHVGVAQLESLTAGKYLRSLRPDIRNRVELKHMEISGTLEAVHAAAIDAEYAIINRNSKPLAPPQIKLQAIAPSRAHTPSRKYCVYQV